jgi:ribosomal protein S18 acetylase RimI-like enzyme
VIAVRRALPSDAPIVAGALARAFEDDPLMMWLVPDAGCRLRLTTGMFLANLKVLALPAGETYTTEHRWGAALWMPPGRWRPRRLEQLRLLPSTIRLVGRRLGKVASALRAVEQRHPDEPHWYLQSVGIDPAHQGQGAGHAVLAPVLHRCDATRAAAYLESSNERNLAFYEAAGFAPLAPVALPDGPTVWPMWRDPRP